MNDGIFYIDEAIAALLKEFNKPGSLFLDMGRDNVGNIVYIPTQKYYKDNEINETLKILYELREEMLKNYGKKKNNGATTKYVNRFSWLWRNGSI